MPSEDDGTMSGSTGSVYPVQLGPGDEIWDFHDGYGGWLRIAAISSGDHEVLVMCQDDPEPLALPASERVEVHQLLADVLNTDPEAPERAEFDEAMAGWYPGDMAAAKDAAAQHAASSPPQGSAEDVDLEPHLHGWYAGDLAFVVHQIVGDDQVPVRPVEPHAVTAAQPQVDDDDDDGVADQEADLESRMSGWYPGDIAAARAAAAQHRADHSQATGPAVPPGARLRGWHAADVIAKLRAAAQGATKAGAGVKAPDQPDSPNV
jgi:hypothetical protein